MSGTYKGAAIVSAEGATIIRTATVQEMDPDNTLATADGWLVIEADTDNLDGSTGIMLLVR